MNVIEAVRKATDPFGMEGLQTAAVRPSATEVIERLRSLGFSVVPSGHHRFIPSYRMGGAASPCATCGNFGSAPIHQITESELRVLDGNR